MENDYFCWISLEIRIKIGNTFLNWRIEGLLLNKLVLLLLDFS